MLLFSLNKNILHKGGYKTTYFNLRNMTLNARQLKPIQFLQPIKSCRSQNRPLMNYFFKRPSLEQCKLIDNIPEPYYLIYKNRMDRYLLAAQVITSVSAVGVTLYLLFEKQLLLTISDLQGASSQNEKIVYITAFVGFSLILQYILYKTPIRIYYWPQQKQYILIFYGKYPSSYRQMRCRVGDVEKLPEKGITPWKDSKYRVKDHRVIFMLMEYFKRPADLFIMMGTQKDPAVDDQQKIR